LYYQVFLSQVATFAVKVFAPGTAIVDIDSFAAAFERLMLLLRCDA